MHCLANGKVKVSIRNKDIKQSWCRGTRRQGRTH